MASKAGLVKILANTAGMGKILASSVGKVSKCKASSSRMQLSEIGKQKESIKRVVWADEVGGELGVSGSCLGIRYLLLAGL